MQLILLFVEIAYYLNILLVSKISGSHKVIALLLADLYMSYNECNFNDQKYSTIQKY